MTSEELTWRDVANMVCVGADMLAYLLFSGQEIPDMMPTLPAKSKSKGNDKGN